MPPGHHGGAIAPIFGLRSYIQPETNRLHLALIGSDGSINLGKPFPRTSPFLIFLALQRTLKSRKWPSLFSFRGSTRAGVLDQPVSSSRSNFAPEQLQRRAWDSSPRARWSGRRRQLWAVDRLEDTSVAMKDTHQHQSVHRHHRRAERARNTLGPLEMASHTASQLTKGG